MPNKYFPLKHQNISLVVIWSSPKAGNFYFLPKKKLKYLKKDQVITKEIAAVFFENLISSQQVFQSACSSAPDQKVNLRKFYFWKCFAVNDLICHEHWVNYFPALDFKAIISAPWGGGDCCHLTSKKFFLIDPILCKDKDWVVIVCIGERRGSKTHKRRQWSWWWWWWW